VSSLAYPIRLQENGLLERGERIASLVALLKMMAQTTQGSWSACPSFGLRDLFENRLRADTARLAQQRINHSLEELGIADYVVTDVVREISAQQETDTYSITMQCRGSNEIFHTTLMPEL